MKFSETAAALHLTFNANPHLMEIMRELKFFVYFSLIYWNRILIAILYFVLTASTETKSQSWIYFMRYFSYFKYLLFYLINFLIYGLGVYVLVIYWKYLLRFWYLLHYVVFCWVVIGDSCLFCV